MINNKYKIGDEVFYLKGDKKKFLFGRGRILAIHIDELGINYSIENLAGDSKEEYILGLVNKKSDYFSDVDARGCISTNIYNMIECSDNEIEQYIEERNLKLVDSIKKYLKKHKTACNISS